MSRVLAFDLGASSGRAVLAEYAGEKIKYKEIHRFENMPVSENLWESLSDCPIEQEIA